MEKEKKYRVCSHMFKGQETLNDEVIGWTYVITFNKSLEHTGRFKGIEDGLNAYCKKERRTDIVKNFKYLWYSILKWLKNLI